MVLKTSRNEEINKNLAAYTNMYSLDNIPQVLKSKPQWVLWKAKYVPEKDKVSKIPINPKNYRNGSTTNPATWTGFKNAVEALKPGYGLGFVLATDDGLTGIDLDNCIGGGVVEGWAQEIISNVDSYTEITPSGTGLRSFVKAEWPDEGNRKGQLEVYTQGRFLTVTGNHLEGTPLTIEPRQKEIDQLHNQYFPKQNVIEMPSSQNVNNVALSDAEVIRIAGRSKQGAEFNRLLNGDWQGVYESQSQADQAFCNMLAFWTGKDAVQIDSIFRESNLYRPKWDEKHGAQTYGEMTISKAIADTRDTFKPRSSAQQDFGKQTYFDGQGTFIPAWLAEDILTEYAIKYAAGELWIYTSGVYRPGGEQKIAKIAQDKLGSATRTSRIKETLDFIKRETFAELPKPQTDFINVKNGRLDWRTGELSSHSPDIFDITQLPVSYDPLANCPIYDRYMETTLDPDVVQLAEEIIGYCLLPDTKYEKAVMCTGAGRNGKSIFLHVIQHLLGPENVANVALQELEENRFRAAELLGKLANLFADLDNRALKGSSFFKMLVSGDTLTAERKFKDPFSFTNYSRLIFSANKLPRSQDTTFAFYERWLIIPFERVFDKNNPATDPDLRAKLADPGELSGILNRALGGLQRLHFAGRFTEPESVKAALNEYQRQNDSVLAYCEDCVNEAINSTLNKQTLYQSYKLWCEGQGLRPVSQTKFKPSLQKAFPQVEEGRVGSCGPRVWFGIEFNEEAPLPYNYHTPRYDFLA